METSPSSVQGKCFLFLRTSGQTPTKWILSCCFWGQEESLNLSDRFSFCMSLLSGAWFVSHHPIMQFLSSAHRWHTWALTHTTDLCSHQHPLFSFQTHTVRCFIPSQCDSLRPARMHRTTSKKCAGRSLSLTILGAFNGTILMDSVSSWFIDRCPQQSCEYSKSYQSLPEITFAHRLSSQKL